MSPLPKVVLSIQCGTPSGGSGGGEDKKKRKSYKPRARKRLGKGTTRCIPCNNRHSKACDILDPGVTRCNNCVLAGLQCMYDKNHKPRPATKPRPKNPEPPKA